MVKEKAAKAPAPAPARRDAHTAQNLDPAHVMDFSNLHLGHASCSKRVVTIVDLDVYVYGLDEIAGNELPVAVAFLSHGWANKAAHMEQMAYGLVGETRRLAATSGRVPTHDMIVVTIDHRNHGPRRRNPNGLVFDNNPARLIQANATLVQDHQLVMDSLGAYLWPRDERVIDEWMFAGVSLGDSRVRIGVPIISIPPERLAGIMTRSEGVPPPNDPDTFVPRSVRAAFEKVSEPGAYAGKKILSVHGAVDQTIPHTLGSSEFERIRAHATHPSHLVVSVHDGAGHVVIPEMVRATAKWFWRWGCSEPAPSAKL